MSMVGTSRSFPSPSPQWRYDVFLSFRGEDTRKRFTGHLYTALESHGIIVFKDDPELPKGATIGPELFTAIEESRFAIIVLSENYASSTWCLDELAYILHVMEESRERVLPVFYDVDPSDVRKQAGSFAEAFTEHEEKLKDDREKVQMWRGALKTVANFSGWDSKDCYESDLIQKIVQEVWKKLRPTISGHVEDLVGMESRSEPIDLFLDGEADDVFFIGIWGIGGIGKTTIAEVVYKKISHEYDFPIFLPKVRNTFERNGLTHLQEQLLSQIGRKKDDIWRVGEGVELIRRFLRRKKVLLVLDDVDRLEQLECLAGSTEWFGCGSRVLITTRSERLLIKHGVEKRYEVHGLNDDEARQLFRCKAFTKDYPEQIHVDLCRRVLNYAKGLPLAVKVLGSFLNGRDQRAWESALDKLREVCNPEIFDVLKISYDGLTYDEQRIFLDIACFFDGMDKDRVREKLEDSGFYADIGIDVLIEKSLLTITYYNTIWMHDLIQEMGREIVRRESQDKPGKRSRLWSRRDIIDVLRKNSGTEAIQGIFLWNRYGPRLSLVNAQFFLKMERLRLLIINNVDIFNGLEDLPNSLQILEWPNFPLKSLPSSFHPEELVELIMPHSEIEYLWKGRKASSKLKLIDLSHSLSLIKTPDFTDIPYLERLVLEGCIKLKEVDPSAGMLNRLTLMNLKDCKNLVHFPSSVRGLKSLKVLNVSGCSKLEKLPDDLGHVDKLEELDASGTAISLRGCKGPSAHSWSIMPPFPLRSFLKLSLLNPTNFSLPSLSGLQFLRKLNLSDCNISEGSALSALGNLPSLQELDLSRNPFVSLPKIISQLPDLCTLYVNDCHDLQELPVFPSGCFFVEALNCNSLDTSGITMIRLFANLSKPGQGQCSDNLRRHDIGDSCRFLRPCRYVVPGKRIPEWFSHANVGSSLSVDLPPRSFSDDWTGIAICAAVVIPEPVPAFYLMAGLDISLYLYSKGGKPSCTSIPATWFHPCRIETDCILFCYLSPFCVSHGTMLDLKNFDSGQLRIWIMYAPPYVEVKGCGVRVLYEGDLEAVMKQTYSTQSRSLRICEEVLEFPADTNSDQQTATSSVSVSQISESGGIAVKRGLQHCLDWAGPSHTQSQTTCSDEDPPHPPHPI